MLRIQHNDNDNNKDNDKEDNSKWMLAPYLQTLGKIVAAALHWAARPIQILELHDSAR